MYTYILHEVTLYNNSMLKKKKIAKVNINKTLSKSRLTGDNPLTLHERSHAETIFCQYHSAAAGSMNLSKHGSCTATWTRPHRCQWWCILPTWSIFTWHTFFVRGTRFPNKTAHQIFCITGTTLRCPGFVLNHHMYTAIKFEESQRWQSDSR